MLVRVKTKAGSFSYEVLLPFGPTECAESFLTKDMRRKLCQWRQIRRHYQSACPSKEPGRLSGSHAKPVDLNLNP